MNHATGVVADTHTFIWYVQGSPRLSDLARATLDSTTDAGLPIVVSAVTVVELRYLVEKGTFDEVEFAAFVEVLNAADSAFVVASMDADVAQAMGHIPRKAIGDPFDRMIAATALALDLVLVTRDQRLHRLTAPVIVW